MKGTITIEINNVDQAKIPDEAHEALNISVNVENMDGGGAIMVIKSLMDSLELTGEMSTAFALMLLGKLSWPFELEDHQRTGLDVMEGDCCTDEG